MPAAVVKSMKQLKWEQNIYTHFVFKMWRKRAYSRETLAGGAVL